MRVFVRSVLVFGVVIALSACGGGGGSDSSTTANPATSAPTVVKAGLSWTMAANSSVLVPAGTTISWNGTVVTVNGSSNTIYTQAGAIVNVPQSATGPANNTVSTGQATAGSTSTATPTVTALAGSATQLGVPVDGTGSAAIFWGRGHMAIDSADNIIVSDRGGLRKVTQAGVVTTLLPGYQPADWEGIAIDATNNIYGSGNVTIAGANPFGASIYELTAVGALENIATNWETSTDPSVGFGGLAVDSKGNLYLADQLNNRIVKFTSAGVMSVFAGSGATGNADGVGTLATFNLPSDLAIDGNDNLYVASSNAIRKITPDGTTSTIYTQSAPTITAITSDKLGNVYVGGIFGILEVASNGAVTSYSIPAINGSLISSLAVDTNGNLYAGIWGQGAQILKISF